MIFFSKIVHFWTKKSVFLAIIIFGFRLIPVGKFLFDIRLIGKVRKKLPIRRNTQYRLFALKIRLRSFDKKICRKSGI